MKRKRKFNAGQVVRVTKLRGDAAAKLRDFLTEQGYFSARGIGRTGTVAAIFRKTIYGLAFYIVAHSALEKAVYLPDEITPI